MFTAIPSGGYIMIKAMGHAVKKTSFGDFERFRQIEGLSVLWGINKILPLFMIN